MTVFGVARVYGRSRDFGVRLDVVGVFGLDVEGVSCWLVLVFFCRWENGGAFYVMLTGVEGGVKRCWQTGAWRP